MSPLIKIHDNLAKLHSNEQFADMIRMSAHAVKDYPQSIVGWHYMGAGLRAVGNIEEAQKAWTKVIQLKPTFADGHINLGTIFQDKRGI